MSSASYPTDVTDEQWELLRDLVPAPKPSPGRDPIDRREIVNGLLYVVRSGIPWRMMPHDLPNWSTFYEYFRQCRDNGVLDQLRREPDAGVPREPRTTRGRCGYPDSFNARIGSAMVGARRTRVLGHRHDRQPAELSRSARRRWTHGSQRRPGVAERSTHPRRGQRSPGPLVRGLLAKLVIEMQFSPADPAS